MPGWMKSFPVSVVLWILSAYILLIAYVYKEVKSEHAKEAVANLVAAETQYQQMINHDEEMASIRALRPREIEWEPANAKQHKLEDDSFSERPLTTYEAWQILLSDRVSTPNPDLEAADVLWKELDDDKDVENARNAAYAEQKRLEELTAKVPASFEVDRPKPITSMQNDLLQSFSDIQPQADKANGKYLGLVVGIAEKQDAQRRKELRSLGDWTLVWYGIGWSLGLLAKVTEPVCEKADAGLPGAAE